MKIFFINKEKIKTFTEEVKLREFVTTRPILKESLKGNSLNNKKMIKAGFLKHQSGRKNTVSKKYGQIQETSSPF